MNLGLYGAGLLALDIIDHLADSNLVLNIGGQNLSCEPETFDLVFYDSSYTKQKIRRIENYSQYFKSIKFVNNPSALVKCHGVLLCVASGMIARRKIISDSRDFRIRWASLFHTTASISRTSCVGPGSLVLPYSTIGPCVSVGSHTIIYNYSTVGHESKIGDNVIICPDVSIGGRVTIGCDSLVSTKCFVYPSVTIGANSVLDPLIALKSDIVENSIVTNVPQNKNRVLRGWMGDS